MAEYSGELFDKKPDVGSAPPTMDEDFAQNKERLRKEFEAKTKKDQTTTMFGQDIPSFFTSPTGMIIEGGLAAEALRQAAKSEIGQKVMGGLKDRFMGKVKEAPISATPEVMPSAAPQPEFPKATTQQSALPQGYGQQTINAPTGAPAVPTGAPQPVAPTEPAAVDPIQAAKIREAEAKAAIAEHKLQQLQAGPKTTPASAKSSVSEAELQMIQKSGAAGTAKELQAMEAANKIAPTPDPVQAIATPVEKQAAVDVVADKQKKQIVGEAGKAVEAPEGRIPSYPNPKRNKQGADVIGQGGWHWYQGQMGPEAEQAWLQQFGRTNQSYADVKQAMKEGRLPSPVLAEGKKGGAFPRETTVPNYIKGSASTKGMIGMLASAGLLGVAGSEKGREAMSRAATAVSDLGISPDVFAGKGEELGKLGKAYITAGNPNYVKEIRTQLETEKDPIRRAILLEEFQKAGGSGAGRGIAPPSSYQR